MMTVKEDTEMLCEEATQLMVDSKMITMSPHVQGSKANELK